MTVWQLNLFMHFYHFTLIKCQASYAHWSKICTICNTKSRRAQPEYDHILKTEVVGIRLKSGNYSLLGIMVSLKCSNSVSKANFLSKVPMHRKYSNKTSPCYAFLNSRLTAELEWCQFVSKYCSKAFEWMSNY